ncbi:hypothetical protein QU487_06185 [Crenobacter sp. SG2305]|uniref:hypothetical protein n=1 Tax=Crenobacter oryzisoli TaxID=3056844 RepID=UPI0025AAE8AE|nr:hypothetical protein [Crenobacter sp. SG2305]MDN0082340.1 hypothetical protein [Crenobacter sp. SG2305]
MERLIPVLGAMVVSSVAWAGLSTPIIDTAAKPAQVSTPNSSPSPATAPAGNAAQRYLPPSLSPQAQINHQATQKPAPQHPQPDSSPKPPTSATASTTSQESDPNNPFSKPLTDVPNGQMPGSAPAPAKKNKLEFRKKKEGRPVYFISVSQPRVEITLYSGTCYADNRPELRQQLIDRGLDSRKRSVLKSAYASTPTGRVKGCWYYVRQGDYFRVALENGQGEDFAREQVDRAR